MYIRLKFKLFISLLATGIISLYTSCSLVPSSNQTDSSIPDDGIITVSNLTNSEAINYELPIIKGKLQYYSDQVCITANGKSSYWKADKNTLSFRGLVHLIPGNNEISITSRHHEAYVFNINYNPQDSYAYRIKFIYILASDGDGSFPSLGNMDNSLSSAKKRLTLFALMMQSAYAETLYESGYGRKTFTIYRPASLDRADFIVVQRVPKTLAQMQDQYKITETVDTAYDFYNYILGQIRSDPNHIKNFVVSGMSKKDKTGDYCIAWLGGGDLAMVDDFAIYTFPEDYSELLNTFSNNKIDPIDKIMGTTGTVCRRFATFGGASMHELGHAFGLHHPDNTRVLMLDQNGNPVLDEHGNYVLTTDYSAIMASCYQFDYTFSPTTSDGNPISKNLIPKWVWAYQDGLNVLNNEPEILTQSSWIR